MIEVKEEKVEGVKHLIYDEEKELCRQVIMNGDALIYGMGDYPLAVTNGDFYKRIGLIDRLMKIDMNTYLFVRRELGVITISDECIKLQYEIKKVEDSIIHCLIKFFRKKKA